ENGLRQTNLVCVEVVFLGDWANLVFADLVRIVNLAAVTEQDSACDFLIQGDSHFLPHPSDNVDSGDVDDVVTVNLLFLVHSGWLSGSLSHGPEHFLLQVATDVATSTSLFVCHVELVYFQEGERTLVDAVENAVDPFLGATKCLWLLDIYEVSFWE